jgi:invasion protein IalB
MFRSTTIGWRAMTPSRSESASLAPRLSAAAVALAMLAIPATVRAEVVVNEEEFRDWIGRCETETDTGEVVCFIYTGRVAEVEGQELAARIVVGIGDNLVPIVYLDVPDTAEPANGFMLRVDQREPFIGRFATCATGWCHTEASGEVGQALIDQFRAGSEATASFILEEQELQVDMPMSLLGFTAAYTQLLNIHQQAAAATPEGTEEPATEEEPSAEDEPAVEDATGEEPAAEPETTEPESEATEEPEAPAAPEAPLEPEAPPAEDAVPPAPIDEPPAQ